MNDPVDASTLDRACARLLGGPCALVLGLLGVVQLALWLPHYLTWPWYSDHDVFWNVAKVWGEGGRPYIDAKTNNFPGTVYLFLILNKLFGPGRTWPLYAFDGVLVAGLGIILSLWSRRRFESVLPGMTAWISWLGYYLQLDYSQTAQRDWHGPFFALCGLLLIETSIGAFASLMAGFLSAVALVIRPQAACLLPAILVSIAYRNGSTGSRLAAAAAWLMGLALGLGLAVWPLTSADALPAFLDRIRDVSLGGDYNRLTFTAFRAELQKHLFWPHLWAVVFPILLLSKPGDGSQIGDAVSRRVWFALLLGVLAYKPLSPRPHAYLDQPITLVLCVGIGVATHTLLASTRERATFKVALLMVFLALFAAIRPVYTNFERTRLAPALLRTGEQPETAPLGYTQNLRVRSAAAYPWQDYRDLLQFLKNYEDRSAPVANALRYFPALLGPTNRRSAFPAESVGWLKMVRRDDDQAFARALEAQPDALVVWDHPNPEFDRPTWFPAVSRVIRRDFEPIARFGPIEVRRRKTPSTPRPAREP